MIAIADELDWRVFLSLAGEEGWRVPQNELDLHRQRSCSRGWAYRHNGAAVGLVTGVLHQRSAWIGNLIIDPQRRKAGIGSLLFHHAVSELRAAGAESLWLTASAQGAPLYNKAGFQQAGTIERWVRKEGGDGFAHQGQIPPQSLAIDAEVWRDDRSFLLAHLTRSGTWIQAGESLALLQRDKKMQIIGPWFSSSPADDARLLGKLINTAGPQLELVVDLLSSSERQGLLSAAGFTRQTATTLMTTGPQNVDWPRLLSLATLGSCG